MNEEITELLDTVWERAELWRGTVLDPRTSYDLYTNGARVAVIDPQCRTFQMRGEYRYFYSHRHKQITLAPGVWESVAVAVAEQQDPKNSESLAGPEWWLEFVVPSASVCYRISYAKAVLAIREEQRASGFRMVLSLGLFDVVTARGVDKGTPYAGVD
jgi:hypothetical protein